MPVAESPTTRRRSKGSTREREVVAAAAALIAERGVDNVRVSDVADRAGMTVGHVGYYFPHKSSLLLRAIELNERAFRDDAADRCRRVADPWARLSLLVELAMAGGPGDRGWVLWLEVWARAGRDADLARRQARLDAEWRLMLADVLRYGVEQSAFRAHDVDALSLHLSCLMDGLSVQVTLSGGDVGAEHARAVVMDAARAVLEPR